MLLSRTARRVASTVSDVTDLDALAPDRPYVVWNIDGNGQAGARAVADGPTVRQLVAAAGDGLVLVVTQLVGSSRDLAQEYRKLLPDGTDEASIGDPRPLTGPFVVPKSWKAPLGAEGFVIGDLRTDGPQRVPLVLVAWPVQLADLEDFADALDRSKNEWPIKTPAHARTRVERLIALPAGNAAATSLKECVATTLFGVQTPQPPELAYAGALRHCERIVDDYEDDFRAGKDFTREQHIRIEQLLQELIMRKGAFTTGAMETERLGLESRLVRLLDAQASRDASGTLQRVLSALTALVLVPTLIAGVFGANVPLPYETEPAMRRAMFALMACGGVLSYLLLSGVRQSSATRGLAFQWPGERASSGEDSTWRGRLLFAALTGAAIGVALEAWWALRAADVEGIRSSTTTWTVALAGVLLIAVSVALAARDVMERSRWHAAAITLLTATAAAGASALLRTGVPFGLEHAPWW